MPRYRIIQVITNNYAKLPQSESAPFTLERSFDEGKTWSALEAFYSYDEASKAKRQWERTWDGENSYVG